MERLRRRIGEIAAFTGGHLYRGREEREIGFRTLIRGEFDCLSILEDCVGMDDPRKNIKTSGGTSEIMLETCRIDQSWRRPGN